MVGKRKFRFKSKKGQVDDLVDLLVTCFFLFIAGFFLWFHLSSSSAVAEESTNTLLDEGDLQETLFNYLRAEIYVESFEISLNFNEANDEYIKKLSGQEAVLISYLRADKNLFIEHAEKYLNEVANGGAIVVYKGEELIDDNAFALAKEGNSFSKESAISKVVGTDSLGEDFVLTVAYYAKK